MTRQYKKKKNVGTNEECLFIVLFQVCCVTSGVLYEDGTKRNFLSGYESSEWATQCSNKLSRYRISFKPEGLYTNTHTHTQEDQTSLSVFFSSSLLASLIFHLALSKMQHSCSSFTSHVRAPYLAQIHPTVARLSTPGLVDTRA